MKWFGDTYKFLPDCHLWEQFPIIADSYLRCDG